jgi:hypothetical protein
VFETFCAIGIGWNKEPDQQIGGFFAPLVPQGVNRSLISVSEILRLWASLVITEAPLSSVLSRTLVLTLTINVDLFDTTGLPTWSRISPRTG